jgi:tetratricopeptide (TPR) repeat protein
MNTSDSKIAADRVERLLLVLVPLAVLAAFWPTLGADFVTWDDDANFLNNPHFRGLGWRNLRWMFTTLHMSNYQPLSWLASGLEYSLWGMRPFGYHATSLALHMLNAALFYRLAVRLLRLAAPVDPLVPVPAASAALFFALHPLRVESVAWLSGQHDLQAGALYLLAMLCYLRAVTDESRRRRWRLGAIALFAAALLSKVNGIALPLVLLLLDFYPLRRLPRDPKRWLAPQHRRIWLEKLPLLAIAVAAGLASLVARQQGGVLQHHDLGFRIQQAFYGLGFDLGKTVAPAGLSPFHPVPLDRRLPLAAVAASAALALVLTAVLLHQRRRRPGVLVAWIYYVVTLLPVSGMLSFGTQLVADRYSYLPCMSWAVLGGAAVLVGRHRLGTQGRRIMGTGLAALLLLLGSLSWRQSSRWHDSETLFRYVLEQRQDIPEVHNNLGFVLVGQRRVDEGMAEYRKALEIKPDFTKAVNNLGLALLGQGRHVEALAQFRKALDLEPDYAFGHNNLGLTLMYLGRPAEALPHFQRAVALAPEYVLAYNNLGGALLTMGRVDEAIAQYRKALELRPDFAAAATMLRIAEAQRPR